MTRYDLTPDEYRTKWKSPADDPMVAQAYAAQRSALAKTMGLGRKPAVAAVTKAVKSAKARAPQKLDEAAE